MIADTGKQNGGIFNAKNLAVMAVMAALLIGAQFALSFIVGIEVVTLLLCAFCAAFGVKRGVITAVVFALLRCLIFGFALNVIVLYLVYYPLFAIVFGFYGKLINKFFDTAKANKKGEANGSIAEPNGVAEDNTPVSSEGTKIEKNPVKRGLNAKKAVVFIGLVLAVGAMTCLFTMIDNVITPAIMGMSKASARIYFVNSLPAMVTQIAVASASVAFLFLQIYRVMKYIKESMRV